MKIPNISIFQIIARNETKFLAVLSCSVIISLLNPQIGRTNIAPSDATVAQGDRTIEGKSGGSTDSQGCGFINNTPSYEMNLESRVDYMRFTVETSGGQPTLLVVGPNSSDSFCVLGDEISGLKPEISGVWEPGFYQIYVGDRTNAQHDFVLDISTDN